MTAFKKVIVDCDGTKYFFPDEREAREKLDTQTTLKQIHDFLINQNERLTQDDAFIIYGLEYRKNDFGTSLKAIADRVGKSIDKSFLLNITSNNTNGTNL
jgi:hypothetical protein